jgi:extradiol dioxygenase family protein
MQSLFHLGQLFATTLTGRVGDQLVPMQHFGLALALPD